MGLTRDQVDSIVSDITNRANAAIANLESQKSLLGGVTGNNDTVEQSEGALRNMINQLPNWQTAGYALADAEAGPSPVDDTTQVANWVSAGQAFVTAVSEVDGYGSSASLNAVVGQTISATVQQVKQGAETALKSGLSFVPWWLWPVGIAAALFIFAPGLAIGLVRSVTGGSSKG